MGKTSDVVLVCACAIINTILLATGTLGVYLNILAATSLGISIAWLIVFGRRVYRERQDRKRQDEEE